MMVGLLLKKQLTDIFRGYFYDAKKNRMRSKAATIGLMVMYVLLMVGLLGGMFTLLSLSICGAMYHSGLGWLYFTLFTVLGLFMGVFGSVFNTFAGLYQAKDNDLLLSLPIPIRAILASRLLGVYLMGLMFSGVIMLPCVIVYWFAAELSAAAVIGGLALILAVSLLALVLSCLLGWVVAKIHSRLKHKNLLTTLVALVLFGAYYAVCFRASALIERLLAHLDQVGAAVRGGAYPLYLMGRMGQGDWLAIALVLAVTALLCWLTYLLLSRTFLAIATAKTSETKKAYKEGKAALRSIPAALLSKELGRLTSSPNYMLNCGLGSVMLPLLGVVLLIKRGDLLPLLSQALGARAPDITAVLLCAALCLVGSMNDMTSSSVSLEGKCLWQIQSLPVRPWQVLRAKLLVQVLITGVPMLLASVCVVLAVRPGLPAVLLVVMPQVFVWLSAAFGLTMDLKRPNLTWTNEITVIKQRLTVLLAMLGRGVDKVVIAIVVVQWAHYARIMRSRALQERRKEYIEAAQNLGFPAWRIMAFHLLPNCLGPVMVFATIQIATAIALEATLSFLGVGVPITEPSLGLLISNGFQYLLSGDYWISLFPGIALLLLILSINIVGDRLRESLDPRK